MKKQTFLSLSSKGFVLLSALSLLSVSLMAFYNPKAVMDLVQTKLPNTDAISSIRGVYGGVGLTIFLSLLYLMKRHVSQALIFLTILWGAYAGSRIITIFAEGPLGPFGSRWLLIESISCLLAYFLYFINSKLPVKKSAK